MDSLSVCPIKKGGAPMGRLDGKVAIITGASSGMARETARLFVGEGAKVVGFARRKERLQELEQELGEAFYGFVGDQTIDQDIESVVAETIKRFGTVDILVNAAGINEGMQPLGNIERDWMKKALSINLVGPMLLMREVLPIMQEKEDGTIINITSIGGIAGCRAGAAYTAAKTGLNGVTRNTAFMYAEKGIRCNAIAPGGYATECIPEDPDEFGNSRCMLTVDLLPKIGMPEQIASVCLFLASDDSQDINGAIIPVDSGWSAA
jgi:NAD(P)-dependent dehydrogenase (short-subunit alcohol dehydrogenase family)